jgi:2-oxoglutarate ferredoxin oxidoreductase subunit beta
VVDAEGADMSRVVIHDAGADDPSMAFQLSRLEDPTMTHMPMGIFRNVSRPSYDDLVRAQVDDIVTKAGGPATDADLSGLLRGKDTWNVG